MLGNKYPTFFVFLTYYLNTYRISILERCVDLNVSYSDRKDDQLLFYSEKLIFICLNIGRHCLSLHCFYKNYTIHRSLLFNDTRKQTYENKHYYTCCPDNMFFYSFSGNNIIHHVLM